MYLCHKFKKGKGKTMEKEEGKKRNKLSIILGVIVLIILFVVLFVNSVIIIKSFIYRDEVPDFMGWKPLITLSGSMEPTISRGDIAMVKEVETETLKVGDIIAFKQENIIIAHRIMEMNKVDGTIIITTKGDSNNDIDEQTVSPENIEGIFIFRVEKLGELAMFIQTSTGMIYIFVFFVGTFLIMNTLKRNKDNKKFAEEQRKLLKEIENLKNKN